MSEPSSSESQLLTVAEAAAWLAVSRATVNRLATAGQLRKVKIGGSARFRARDVVDLIERGTDAKDDDPAGMPGRVETVAGVDGQGHGTA